MARRCQTFRRACYCSSILVRHPGPVQKPSIDLPRCADLLRRRPAPAVGVVLRSQILLCRRPTSYTSDTAQTAGRGNKCNTLGPFHFIIPTSHDTSGLATIESLGAKKHLSSMLPYQLGGGRSRPILLSLARLSLDRGLWPNNC